MPCTEGNTRILRLPAWHLAVEFGVAKQCCSVALLVYLGGRALGVQALSAHETAAAGDIERHHYPITGLKAVHLVTAFMDEPPRFVVASLWSGGHSPGDCDVYSCPEPGSAIRRCAAALTLSGSALFITA